MFRTGLMSIIGSLNAVFTATGICHAIYVECQRDHDGTDLASRQSA